MIKTLVAWCAAPGFKGLTNWLWVAIVGAVIAAIWIAVAVADRWHENTIDVAKDAGAAGAIIQGQNQTFEQLGDANDAEADIRSGGERNARKYVECLRDAREPAGCERYNPDASE